MNIAFYTGASGMIAYQKQMDVISHNMANVNTDGFKPIRASFSDVLYSTMDINYPGDMKVGHGAKVSDIDLLMLQGSLKQTEQALDFAIVGDGFFAVDRGGDLPEYTRAGAFTIGTNGSKAYLVTGDGAYVLDGKGNPIELPFKEGTNVVDTSGVADQLGIYTFSNPFGLTPVGDQGFVQSATSGAAAMASTGASNSRPYKLVSGALEFSKTDMGEEMTNVIQAQRAFQFNARIVQTADELEEMINNLR